jgi:outer membrane biosynthesis protein TonB
VNISEFIGLIISIAAFLFVLFGNFLKKSAPQTDEQKKKLKDFLDALKKDMQVDEEAEEEEEVRPILIKQKAPPPPPLQPPTPMPQKNLVKKQVAPQPVKTSPQPLIRSAREMVLMREILDSPRAYRPWNIRHF